MSNDIWQFSKVEIIRKYIFEVLVKYKYNKIDIL